MELSGDNGLSRTVHCGKETLAVAAGSLQRAVASRRMHAPCRSSMDMQYSESSATFRLRSRSPCHTSRRDLVIQEPPENSSDPMKTRGFCWYPTSLTSVGWLRAYSHRECALTTEGKILVLCPHIFVFKDTDTCVFVKVLNTGAYSSLERASKERSAWCRSSSPSTGQATTSTSSTERSLPCGGDRYPNAG